MDGGGGSTRTLVSTLHGLLQTAQVVYTGVGYRRRVCIHDMALLLQWLVCCRCWGGSGGGTADRCCCMVVRAMEERFQVCLTCCNTHLVAATGLLSSGTVHGCCKVLAAQNRPGEPIAAGSIGSSPLTS
jgi:hypothetical protein